MGLFDKAKEKFQDLTGRNQVDAITGASVPTAPGPNAVTGINSGSGDIIDETANQTNVNPPVEANQGKDTRDIETRVDSLKTEAGLAYEYNLTSNQCFRVKVNEKYKLIAEEDDKKSIGERIVDLRKTFDVNKRHPIAAKVVYNREPEFVKNALTACLRQRGAQEKKNNVSKDSNNKTDTEQPIRNDLGGPFDRRLYREYTTNDNQSETRIPFSIQYQSPATTGLFIGEKYLEESKIDEKGNAKENLRSAREALAKDPLYIGVPALQNTYALVKLYGSNGGKRLINQKNQRRWYEVDQSFSNGRADLANFSSNPTTTSLIFWGNGDPYGRTPYHFTDFVFAKYWNKIENNRLITLRRYGAPIVDNLKFPGMDGDTKLGSPGKETNTNNDTDQGTTDKGSGGRVTFPPMAQAITYFGEETGNNLSDLLKFSTGVKWGEVKSNVWEVSATSTPDSQSGPTGLYKGIGSLSKMLAVAGGDFNPQLIMNKGQLPPDPYKEGPYENRILGPVNRIDSVKRREAGLEFEWSGLNLQFEYVARPVGGVNPKAVLLDILSNFLVIGSASAVFFGGQHRFMTNPAQYPFLGGDEGIEAWYSGKPLKYGQTAINSFVNQVTNKDGGIAQGGMDFFNQLLGKSGEGGIKGIFGAVAGLFSDGGKGSNIIKSKLAEKSAGQVPYLSGMKALLTGEPVGEWHVTIGNPLNPVAMIGNLICTGVEVEFGNELGPDDFPTEIKFTVKLDHGMPRDRDAIQSIFNRGMGRIYDLPDEFDVGRQTAVDANTQDANETGQPLAIKGWLAGPSKLGGRTGPSVQKQPSNHGSISVWNRAPFQSVSPNESILTSEGEIARSGYRQIDWLALKSLK
jgi:hypothetical protein